MYVPEQAPNNLDFDYLAKEFEYISGSDISNCVLNAAFKAARLKKTLLEQELVEEAIKNIIDSKKANDKNKVIVTKKVVSEEYAKSQMKLQEGEK